METIAQVLRVLFLETKSDDVIDSWLSQLSCGKYQDSEINQGVFSRQLVTISMANTLDQGKVIHQVLVDKLMCGDKDCQTLVFSKRPSVFNVLLHYAKKCLVLHNDSPICKYKELLSWHDITRLLGEDLLVASFLASYDIKRGVKRKEFDWKSYLDHDAVELNHMFSREMMDIHAHLKGSSYNFELNWIYLMNHISGLESKFRKFDNNTLLPESRYTYRRISRSLYVKIILAAAIRQFLYKVSNDYDSLSFLDIKDLNDNELKELLRNIDLSFLKEKNQEGKLVFDSEKKLRDKMESIALRFKSTKRTAELFFMRRLLRCTSLEELAMYIEKSQGHIDLLSYEKGRRYRFRDGYVAVPDYAINGDETSVRAILTGERKLMYQVFNQIYSGEFNAKGYSTLFYIYLLIKEEFRKELVQINDTVGFENFSLYENRKADFIPYNSVYDRLLPQLAVGTFLDRLEGDERYMEVRITPKSSVLLDEQAIKQADHYILDLGLRNFEHETDIQRQQAIDLARHKKDKFYYIFHFIKLKDIPCKEESFSCMQPRHAKLRESIKQQAMAVWNFRSSGSSMVYRLVGIDAANSEIFCRPEVFATAFRYLTRHKIERIESVPRPQDLGLTYHVGEDFYDIIDGLRAVDEVLTFLCFRNGSRLGHGLVLGTDVKKYYSSRNFRVNATKQTLLDNAAWLYEQGQRLGASTSILSYLHKIYQKYFRDIYKNKVWKRGEDNDVSIYTYYQSWLLRGDSPYCYVMCENTKEDKYDVVVNPEYQASIAPWNVASLNNLEEVVEARSSEMAKVLYFRYHYDSDVKRIGSEGEILRIEPTFRKELLELIGKVQLAMLGKLEKYHIAIECNPSSNYKIGEIQRYDEHPITKFYNKGLSTPYPCQHIAVSINTDDAGVFGTSLEREYSLMALALEKHEDENNYNSPRAIMDWLENIRQMTFEQKFHKSQKKEICGMNDNTINEPMGFFESIDEY